MAAAKEIGKPPAVVAPSWFGKVPTIQQQLEFHTFKQVLEQSHDLRKQAAFEKAHFRFLRIPENTQGFRRVPKHSQQFLRIPKNVLGFLKKS